MKESGSVRTRAMSNSTTPSVARAGVMISASAAISSSLLSGLEWILKRRMTIGPPVGETALEHTMLFWHGHRARGSPLSLARAFHARSVLRSAARRHGHLTRANHGRDPGTM